MQFLWERSDHEFWSAYHHHGQPRAHGRVALGTRARAPGPPATPS
jgi:hypothetical protein